MLCVIAFMGAIKQRRKLRLHIEHSFRRRLLYEWTQLAQGILITSALCQQQYAIVPLVKRSYRLRLPQGAQLSRRSFSLCACRYFKIKFVEDVAGFGLVSGSKIGARQSD